MISQLNQRERIFVFAGGFALILALLYFAIVAPYRNALSRLDRQIAIRSVQLEEDLIQRTAGRENLLSMRPQSPEVRKDITIDSVEIKLEKLTLRQLLEFLLGIEEATTPMQVKNLYLKQRFDDRSLLDASLTVTALRRTT